MKKILLTGDARVGKTTLFRKLIDRVPRKQGFLTHELRRDGERCGFGILTAAGTEGLLAGVDRVTPHFVKGRTATYYVDIPAFEALLEPLFTFKSDDLLYLDEIGQMEMFSETFKRLVDVYLESDQPFLGTISKMYRDGFIEQVLGRTDIQLIEVTLENRDRLFDEVSRMLA